MTGAIATGQAHDGTQSMDPKTLALNFINHASVILDTGPVRLLSDPWLSGSAFNDGWDLLVPNAIDLDDLEFTHLWYSHEHPDHFAPADLLRLDPGRRAHTPVLFQRTDDGKVAAFCRRQGFPVVEMENYEPLSLHPEVTVSCAKVHGFDSWLLLQAGGHTVLNLNDGKPTDAELERIARASGPLDLLLTQFSYASWVGNEPEMHRMAAEQHLGYMEQQIRALRPRYVTPFASFSWYSHEESEFLNAGMATVHRAVEVITALGAEPVVLYPGDRWILGQPHDNTASLGRWDAAYAALKDRPLRRSESVSLAVIEGLFRDYRRRVMDNNDPQAIKALQADGDLPPALIHLWDLDLALRFDIVGGLEVVSEDAGNCDIRMHSQSLAYLLRHDWGRGSVMISGRVRCNYETLWRFLRQTQIAYANNMGKRFPDSFPVQMLKRPPSVMAELVNRRKELASGP